MKFVNLTPHDVSVINQTGTRVYVRDGTVARVSQVVTPIEELDGVTISEVKFGPVVGLPDPVDGVRYIVSAVVKNAVNNRTDLVSPGELVRDDAGNVLGCKQFFR